MKRLILIVFCFLSLAAMAESKKIALLEPRVGEGSTDVTGMEKAMIRGELRKAIVNHNGYEAFTRSDIDQMMLEQPPTCLRIFWKHLRNATGITIRFYP